MRILPFTPLFAIALTGCWSDGRPATGSPAWRPVTIMVEDVPSYSGTDINGATHYKIHMPAYEDANVRFDLSSFHVLTEPATPPDADPNEWDAFANNIADDGFQFTSGWSYFTGTYPAGRTRRVKGHGYGTTFIMHVVNDNLDRVFILPGTAGSKVKVTTDLDYRELELDTDLKEQYVEIREDRMITSPQHVPAASTDPLRAFINSVKSKAATIPGLSSQ